MELVTQREVFTEGPREVKMVEETLSLTAILSMVESREERDREILSVTCDDQANV